MLTPSRPSSKSITTDLLPNPTQKPSVCEIHQHQPYRRRGELPTWKWQTNILPIAPTEPPPHRWGNYTTTRSGGQALASHGSVKRDAQGRIAWDSSKDPRYLASMRSARIQARNPIQTTIKNTDTHRRRPNLSNVVDYDRMLHLHPGPTAIPVASSSATSTLLSLVLRRFITPSTTFNI